jgi:hypothetical protein
MPHSSSGNASGTGGETLPCPLDSSQQQQQHAQASLIPKTHSLIFGPLDEVAELESVTSGGISADPQHVLCHLSCYAPWVSSQAGHLRAAAIEGRACRVSSHGALRRPQGTFHLASSRLILSVVHCRWTTGTGAIARTLESWDASHLSSVDFWGLAQAWSTGEVRSLQVALISGCMRGKVPNYISQGSTRLLLAASDAFLILILRPQLNVQAQE